MIVECYYNVRRKMFSVRRHTKVIAHQSHMVLLDARFKVSEPGRQRVLSSGHKNVHAFVRGLWSTRKIDPVGYREAYYNPRITESFIDKETSKPLASAKIVILKDGKIYYSNKESHPCLL